MPVVGHPAIGRCTHATRAELGGHHQLTQRTATCQHWKAGEPEPAPCWSCGTEPVWRWDDGSGMCRLCAAKNLGTVGVAIGYDELATIVGEELAARVIEAGRRLCAQDL